MLVFAVKKSSLISEKPQISPGNVQIWRFESCHLSVLVCPPLLSLLPSLNVKTWFKQRHILLFCPLHFCQIHSKKTVYFQDSSVTALSWDCEDGLYDSRTIEMTWMTKLKILLRIALPFLWSPSGKSYKGIRAVISVCAFLLSQKCIRSEQK